MLRKSKKTSRAMGFTWAALPLRSPSRAPRQRWRHASSRQVSPEGKGVTATNSAWWWCAILVAAKGLSKGYIVCICLYNITCIPTFSTSSRRRAQTSIRYYSILQAITVACAAQLHLFQDPIWSRSVHPKGCRFLSLAGLRLSDL